MNVQLRLNEKNLLRNLRYTFSHRSTVISELMQNARRAGASRIAFTRNGDGAICVRDDGAGIHDLQILFSIAESDWSDELTQEEHPFGMGFLAALFAADQVLVSSNGARIEFRTEDLFAQRPIPVTRCEKAPGTYMELTGDWPESLVDLVKPLAMGFPIEVLVDGTALPRPHAIDQGLPFLDSEIGRLFMSDFIDAEDASTSGGALGATTGGALGASRLVLYLQGLPLRCHQYRPFGPAGSNIVHLDSRRFMARMPDRDCLIDQEEHVEAIERLIKQRWQNRLREIKAKSAPADFAKRYLWTLREWDCVDLLNDVDVVPEPILFRVADMPVLLKSWEDPWYQREYSGPEITRQMVEDGMALLTLPSDPFSPWGLKELHYAYRTRALCADTYWLSPEHWLCDHFRSCETRVDVESVGDSAKDRYTGEWVDVAVRQCEQIALKGTLGTVTVSDECVYLQTWSTEGDAEGELLIPAEARAGNDIRQVSTFQDQDGQWHEDVEDREVARFSSYLLALRAGTGAAVLKEILQRGDLQAFPSLLDQTYRVVLSGQGNVTVTLEDESG